MLLRIFCITIHYLLHLATCLHVVNLYAHDPIYVNICMPQKKKKFPEITPNSRIICYGHYYIHVGYFATTEVQSTQDIYISWLLSRMSIWPREITNALWDSLHEKISKLWLQNTILLWKSNFQPCMPIDLGIMLLYK